MATARDPKIDELLKELGRTQTAIGEYRTGGRDDLAKVAERYFQQLTAGAQANGIDLGQYTKNGSFLQYYTSNGGPAGTMDMSAQGAVTKQGAKESAFIDQSGNAKEGAFKTTAAPAPAPAQPEAPKTTPLPTSNATPTVTAPPSASYNGPSGVRQIDMGAVQNRATRDARMQIDALRNQAQTNYNRFKSDVERQMSDLDLLYSGMLEDVSRGTELSARDALERAAMRGFVTDGMAMGADIQARLTGEREASRIRREGANEIGQLQRMLAQQGVELNDMLGNLTRQEQDLVAKLMDDYAIRERENNLQEYGLTSDTALKLLGMDTQWNQFQQNLNWDMSKYNTDLAQRQYEFGQQYGLQDRSLQEQIAARIAGQQIQRDQMAQQGQQWNQDFGLRQGQQQWQQGFAEKQFQFDQNKWNDQKGLEQASMALQDKWKGWDYSLGQQNLGLNRERFEWDKTNTQNESLAGNADRQWAMGQLTAKYMDDVDQMLAQLASGNPDPELAANGITTPQSIIDYYKARGMKITSEGADLNKIIQYIRSRSGLGGQADDYLLSPGPRNNKSQLLKPVWAR